jgi:hypothetical protein
MVVGGEHRQLAFPRGDDGCHRLGDRRGVVERDDARAEPGDRGEPLGPRRIGEDQSAVDIGDRGLQLLRLPPAVEQGRDAACDQNAHVEHDPRRRVARRDPDPVAFRHPEPAGQRPRDSLRLREHLAVRQPRVAGVELGAHLSLRLVLSFAASMEPANAGEKP